MDSRELAVAMMRLGAESLRALMIGDPALTPRLGLSVVSRGGLWCYSSRKLDVGVFNHVSGYGTFVPATQRAIDAVRRHYDEVGRGPAFEVLVPTVSRGDRALLERNGFKDRGVLFQCHVRTSSRPARAHDVAGLSIERARPVQALRYAKLATKGFGDGTSVIASVFERGWTREIKRDRRVASFIGSLNGRDAATGTTILRPRIAGLYSGSVLPRYRGRGIQNAMIAARVAFGWSRGIRIFYSWSDPDTASAENLHDEGFRTRFEVHWFRAD
jgi:GNAT superfamily N-acetyltransferase